MLTGQQRQATDRLAVLVQLDDQARFVGQRQQVTGAAIEMQAGQVANEDARIALAVIADLQRVGRLRVEIGKPVHFIDAHGIALLGDKQALTLEVIGKALEALVLAAHLQAQRHLLPVSGIDRCGAVIDPHLDQPLGPLVSDHEAARRHILHRLGVSEADQLDLPQHLAVERQLDQFGVLVGDGKQALPIRVVRQRRDVVLEPFDRLRLDHHLVVVQPQRVGRRIVRLAYIEPGPLEQPKLLTGNHQCGKHNQHQQQKQSFD